MCDISLRIKSIYEREKTFPGLNRFIRVIRLGWRSPLAEAYCYRMAYTVPLPVPVLDKMGMTLALLLMCLSP